MPPPNSKVEIRMRKQSAFAFSSFLDAWCLCPVCFTEAKARWFDDDDGNSIILLSYGCYRLHIDILYWKKWAAVLLLSLVGLPTNQSPLRQILRWKNSSNIRLFHTNSMKCSNTHVIPSSALPCLGRLMGVALSFMTRRWWWMILPPCSLSRQSFVHL